MQKDTNKNLKDTENEGQKDTISKPVIFNASSQKSFPYDKTYKLVTAMYMVTDVMDKVEPIRHKLRNLGVEILSDTRLMQYGTGKSVAVNICSAVDEVLSFLKISVAMNLISEMNFSILEKEFLKLKSSISEALDLKPSWLSEFLGSVSEESSDLYRTSDVLSKDPETHSTLHKGQDNISKGHTRLGLQKGSTLMQALSDNKLLQSFDQTASPKYSFGVVNKNNFDLLKKERRHDIVTFISKNGGSATITDIKNGHQGSLASCGEKTLQRELLSMTKDGVLKKTGEKRWSRYSLAK